MPSLKSEAKELSLGPVILSKPQAKSDWEPPVGDLGAAGVPESWNCVGCGMNTAPGMLDRKQMRAAFTIGDAAQNTITWESEVYTVKPAVWRAAGMVADGGCLCIGCLEERIGRQLQPKDFLRKSGFHNVPGSIRLISRRMGLPEKEVAELRAKGSSPL